MVVSHQELPWDITYLSKNPNITIDIVKSNIHLPWNWDALSFNSMKKSKEQYIKKKVDELKLIDGFKLINKTNNLFPNVIETVIITYILT
jgi:hypothetical protein